MLKWVWFVGVVLRLSIKIEHVSNSQVVSSCGWSHHCCWQPNVKKNSKEQVCIFNCFYYFYFCLFF